MISTACIITSNYLPKIGGIETQTNILAKAFIRKGVATHIITESFGHHEDDQMMNSVTRIRGHHYPFFIDFSVMMLTLLRFLRQKNVDLIICRSITKITIIPLILKSCNLIRTDVVIFVDTYEELDYIENLPYPGKMLIKFLLNGKSILIAPSSGVREKLIQLKYREGNIALIPNGIEVIELKLNNQELIVLNSFAFLGTLNSNKGITEVVNVFLTLCPLYPSLLLYVAGDGLLRSELSKKVKSHGLDNQIIFEGSILTASDRNLFLQNKNYFIFASKRETFGLSVFEAASLGLTIFTRPVADIPRYLSECAYFFETESDLKDLVLLALEKNLPLKNNERRFIKSLDIDNIAKILLNKDFFSSQAL
jgi:glycosyltransferase involved in cell wall biosynthesis